MQRTQRLCWRSGAACLSRPEQLAAMSREMVLMPMARVREDCRNVSDGTSYLHFIRYFFKNTSPDWGSIFEEVAIICYTNMSYRMVTLYIDIVI